MKITIDTKEDSHEEIQKVIKMLSSLVGQEVISNSADIFADSNRSSSSDMFGDDSSSIGNSDLCNCTSRRGNHADTYIEELPKTAAVKLSSYDCCRYDKKICHIRS